MPTGAAQHFAEVGPADSSPEGAIGSKPGQLFGSTRLRTGNQQNECSDVFHE